ncbi:hypothetical protein GCM10010123_16330 [Pilimelia anulata]|uniref:MobA-like NTP transferase domain-containing protein n=1 Tax=Pilimelia anulata TaxID=53371 RepID=A0A8J3B1D8_9ACTN|nr:hypothetical protein GCM10010123_16330 [Pilimelia anulata]
MLAGGAGRRLGGPDKPDRAVAGRSMRDRVLAAVADAAARLVVGPPGPPLPPGVRRAREDPPGGGPVAAASAGLAALDTAPTSPAGPAAAVPAVVALLAADLPLLDPPAVARLLAALAADPAADAALYVDGGGRYQYLCGVWRTAALRAALAAAPPAGRPVRALLAGRRVVGVTAGGPGPAPWFDCDTEAELRAAREWAR